MATVERRLDRLRSDRDGWLLPASRGALLAIAVAVLLARGAGVDFDMETQAAVYLFGMVALNLPFGGYENLRNLAGRGLPVGARYVGAYLFVAVGFAALFFLAPVAGLVVACAVAVAKGGHGGLRVLDAVVGTPHLRTRAQRVLAAAVRGGAVMIVPLYAWPGDFAAYSTYMVGMFRPGAFAAAAPYFEPARQALGAGLAVAVLAHVAGGVARARREELTAWAVDVGETALLIAYFAIVPVVIAVGLYFPLWYSLRQSARAAAVREPGSGAGRTGGTVAALLGGAVVTASLAGLFAVAVPNPLAGGSVLVGGVAFFTVFVSIVALPHVVVGGWLDTDRGIWYVP